MPGWLSTINDENGTVTSLTKQQKETFAANNSEICNAAIAADIKLHPKAERNTIPASSLSHLPPSTFTRTELHDVDLLDTKIQDVLLSDDKKSAWHNLTKGFQWLEEEGLEEYIIEKRPWFEYAIQHASKKGDWSSPYKDPVRYSVKIVLVENHNFQTNPKQKHITNFFSVFFFLVL